jgi:hypothetical protein
MALFEKPALLILFLLLIGGAVVVLVVVLAARPGAGPRSTPAVPQAGSSSDAPMTLHAGRWLRWDGTQWRDAESGSPIVGIPGPPS